MKESALEMFGEDFTAKTYLTDPAIAREKEIKELILILLTPEKSAILVGKAGIGKTAIVEGLAYRMHSDSVPDALKGFNIVKVNTSSLLGHIDQVEELVKEIREKENLILFIDEIHTLMGANNENPIDLANMLKPGLDRGTIKMIGATTVEEYERYLVRDKAFLRRFVKIEVIEPDQASTTKILMGTLPKLEAKTNVKLKYSEFTNEQLMKFIVEATSEYKRVYEISSRYPDISLTILQRAFSFAVYDNEQIVDIKDIYKAIKTAQSIYPDSIAKELIRFKSEFKELIEEEQIVLD
jgi:ATP-dependent Clp protease ATP-binding subunit ClpA